MRETLEVAVPISKEETFHYIVPKHLREGVKIGKRVLVPLRKTKALGFIIGFSPPPEGVTLKEIVDIVDEEPLFDEKKLGFFRWISSYYFVPLGIVLQAAHPRGLGVTLKKTVKITEKGEVKLRRGLAQGLESHALRIISTFGEIKLEKALKLIDGATYELINSLSRRNLIELNYGIGQEVKPKFNKILIPLRGKDALRELTKKYPKKTEIFEFILTHGGVSYLELKEIFGVGDIGAHVRWLESSGLIRIEQKEVPRDPFSEIRPEKDEPPELTVDQELAYGKIKEAIERGRFSPYLLHGVTGSGKTEVYLRAIADVLAKGKEALVLVPEISLTPQLVKRFRARFGDKVSVIHSALSEGERVDTWYRARKGEIKILLGARSAIFAPFSDPGIIVIDEEHEPSYKQEETPRYNARDLALVLGRIMDAVVVLGSATPSVESYANSLREKFTYLSLPLRVENRPLPEVEVVDMKGEKEGKVFSRSLKEALCENFAKRRQTILFLNRRGFSTLLLCPKCGTHVKCPNCSISLTYHTEENSVKCHYCGLSERFVSTCGECGGRVIRLGMGTQRIERELKRILPEARVERMDRDAIGGKTALLSLYKKLEGGEVDVLIGTQMVAKGHDLPGVTLVGIISADTSLSIPDFRSSERTFQLITQVAGRAGRGEHPGRVLVQTYNPEHYSVSFSIRQDTIGFLERELKFREELEYPPFSRLINFKFQGQKEEEVARFASQFGRTAKGLASKLPIGKIKILGPSPAPIYKIRNRYRWQMLLKSDDTGLLQRFSKKVLASTPQTGIRKVRVSVDVDPLSML